MILSIGAGQSPGGTGEEWRGPGKGVEVYAELRSEDLGQEVGGTGRSGFWRWMERVCDLQTSLGRVWRGGV